MTNNNISGYSDFSAFVGIVSAALAGADKINKLHPLAHFLGVYLADGLSELSGAIDADDPEASLPQDIARAVAAFSGSVFGAAVANEVVAPAIYHLMLRGALAAGVALPASPIILGVVTAFTVYTLSELFAEHWSDEIDKYFDLFELDSPLSSIFRDPLILDLDGDGIELVALADSTVHFDYDGDGFAERTGWVRPDDGLLVRDINGNGLKRIAFNRPHIRQP